MRSRLIVVALFASALIWMAFTQPTSTHAAVGLISFDVEQVEEGIRVTWETGSEVNNLGFNLYRSVTPGSLSALLDFFPAAGGVGGAQYEYLDTDVLPDTTYYYTLEALDVNGMGQYFGPRVITYQPAPNATAPPTFTFTPYPTATIVPVTISFTADNPVIDRGTCTYLRWSVSGAQIQAVYLDGLQVALSGTKQVCPADTTTYSLIVI